MLDQPSSTLRAGTRHDWTVDEIAAIHDQALLDLVAEANRVHRANHDPSDVQRASLLSIKTGGCPEDCAYCPQSALHEAPKKYWRWPLVPDRPARIGFAWVRRGAVCVMAESSTPFSEW